METTYCSKISCRIVEEDETENTKNNTNSREIVRRTASLRQNTELKIIEQYTSQISHSPHFIRSRIRKQLIRDPQLTLSNEIIQNIMKKLPDRLGQKWTTCCELLEELKNEYIKTSTEIILNITVVSANEATTLSSDDNAGYERPLVEKQFVMRRKARLDGNILYYFSFIRYLIAEAQKLLPIVFIDCSKYSGFKGFYHPEILISMMEKEIDREDSRMVFDWFGKLFMHVSEKEFFLEWKENKVSKFINLIIQITKTIALDRIYGTLKALLDFFTDPKTTPKIAVQVYHSFDGTIVIIPTAADVCKIYCNLIKRVYDMGKNFEHFEMFHMKKGRRGCISLEKYDNIRDMYEDKIQDFVTNMYKQLIDHYNKLSEKYSELMDDTLTSCEKLTGMNMEELIQMADRYITIKGSITEIELNTYFSHFKANNKALIKALFFITECRTNQIINEVLKFHVEYCERHCEEFYGIVQKAVKVPETTEELISLAKFMNFVNTDQMDTMRENILRYLELFYRVMEVVTVPEKYLEMMGHVLGWVTFMESIIKQNSSMLEATKLEFEERLNTVTEKLNEDLENFSTEELDGLDHLDDYSMIKTYTLHIMKCLRKVQHFDDTAKWINKEETLFEMTLSTYPELDEIKAFVNPFAKLVFQLYKWNMVYEAIMDGSLEILTVRSVEETLEEYSNLITQLKKWFKTKIRQQANENNPRRFKGSVDDSEYDNWPAPLKLLHGAQQNLNEIKKHMDFIALLCNPRMTSKHWAQISSIAGRDMTPYKGSSLRIFINFKVEDKIKEFEVISESAVKEYQLEESLMQMKNEWQHIHFVLSLSEVAHGMILDSTDHIQSLVDDHIVKTLSIRSSEYVKPIEDDLKNWFSKLGLVNTIIEEWSRVQNQWLYFMPIFSSPSISNQIEDEAKLFRVIDVSYRNLLQEVQNHSLVMVVVSEVDVLPLLESCSQNFEKINIGVKRYLEKKRIFFSRFFFLSDEDMLQFLSQTKDPNKSELFLKKCFTGISKLGLDDLLNIKSIISSHNEVVRLEHKVNTIEAKGSVEKWLAQVEDQMIISMHSIMKKGISDYTLKNRKMWIQKWPGQIVHCVSKLYWTNYIEKCFCNQGHPELEKHHKILLDNLKESIGCLQSDLSNNRRITLVSLIVLDVHSKDVTNELIKNKVASSSDFLWLSQLRYYWEEDLKVKILNASVQYGYEYLGNIPRIVITPLTERCYRTLIGAYNLHNSGSLEGPSSTGKTDTIKDLAHAIAIYCHVFSCSLGMNLISIEKFLKAIASSGSWICFHDFDRIEPEIVSIIAQRMLTISQAIRQKLATFVFAGTTLTLNPACFICITLNPGYSGRFELPTNLKVLFRPVAVVVPDFTLIAEIFLLSNGFQNSNALAKKIVMAMQLCSEILPPQPHNDFGLTSLKAILSSANMMKLHQPNNQEKLILMKSFIDINLPKIAETDVPLFNGIIQDVFHTERIDSALATDLLNSIIWACKEKNLQPEKKFLLKVSQTYEIMSAHHNIMLLGGPFGGKTSALEVVSRLNNSLSKESIDLLSIDVINPKAVTLQQLFGHLHPVTCEWTDGIVGKIFRPLMIENKNTKNWVVFDGPVSSLWMENMNTALDDKKMIFLMSGEIIEITPSTSIIFECMDVIEASPSTVSRCRIVHFEATSIGWKPIVKSWNANIPKEWLEDSPNRFITMFDWLIPLCSNFMMTNCKKNIDIGIENVVRTVCDFIESMLHGVTQEQDLKYINTWTQAVFVQAVVWCLGGILDRKSRESFDSYVRSLWQNDESTEKSVVPLEIDITLPTDGLLEDNSYIFKSKGSWKYWPEILRGMKLDDIYNPYTNTVSTLDSLKYSAVLENFIRNKKPFLLLGQSGTGKTTLLRNLLMTSFLNENFVPAFFTFTVATTAGLAQELILSKLIKKRKGTYGSSGNRTSIILIEDINVLQKEENTHPPLELLRQYLDYGYWYDLKSLEKLYLEDLFFIAVMGSQSIHIKELSPRFLRHFALFSINPFTDDSLAKIYTTILFLGLRKNGFPADIMGLAQQVVSATIFIFRSINKHLFPTPAKCHYIFSIRDLMRIFQGYLLMRKETNDGKKAFIRLWIHEVLRVFYDRLINNFDRIWLFNELKNTLGEVYKEELDKILDASDDNEENQANLQHLSNVIYTTAFDLDSTENQKYEEIPSLEAFWNLVSKALEEYKLKNKSFSNVILFRYSVEHVARIHRIISVPNGNGVLIGVNGTGRQCLVKLATFMSRQKLFQPNVDKIYGNSSWIDDLKNVLKESGAQNISCVLLLNEAQLNINYIIQDIDSVLSTGEVPNLFALNEVQDIVEVVRLAAQREKINTNINPLAVFEYFINRCKKNLHIMLCLNPICPEFQKIIRKFPSIVKCCTLDWFETEWTLNVNGRELQTTGWPEDALQCIAKEYLVNMEINEKLREPVIDICKYFHVSTRKASSEFYNSTRKKIYITSTSYIDLLKHYAFWAKKKRDELEHSKERYLGGLEKLEFAASQVEIMQRDLESLQPALKKAAEETSEMLKVIETETFEVEKASERVRLDEEIANEQAMGAMELKTECENDLAQAIPILEDAVAALNTLKPADITLVKSMKNPPETVKLVLAAVCVMKGIKPDRLPDPKNPGRRINDYWGPSKRLLGDMSFLQQLKDYDKDNIPGSIMKAVRSQYLNHKDFKPKVVAKASSAAEGLCKWVIALEKYDVVVKEVAPKKEKLRIAEKEYSETMAILEEKRNLLRGLEDKLAELKDNLKQANERKIRLQNEVVLCSNKLQKAQRIIGSLGGEKERWVQVAEELKKQYYEIPGNILLSCGIIAYLSPFTPEFRQNMIEDWWDLCRQLEIPISEDYSLLNALGSRVLVEQWRINGLPRDSFSTDNAIILDSSEKWPLIIDPQNQANKWIKNMEKTNELNVIRLSGNYAETVKYCVKAGKPVLLENIKEEIDPFFDSILRKYLFIKDERVFVNLGEATIEYNKNFRFYITSRLNNPHYPPKIYKHLTVINFVLSEDGLADQLLEIVVAKERPELQEKRKNLIRESTKNKQDLQKVEDKILKTLSSVLGNILEDENAVNSLDSSKTIAEEIKRKDAADKQTIDDIELFRRGYKSVGYHCAALYKTITNLSILNHVYQYSLDWFIKIFTHSIDAALKTDIPEERIKSLKETFNYSLYINISYTLFEKDKILYSFVLCKILMLKENKLSNSEVGFLLEGERSYDGEAVENPASEWLPQKIWNEIQRIDSNPIFEGFMDCFRENIDCWKMFYFTHSPTSSDIPLSWSSNLTNFQKLIILKGLRPDRFLFGIISFIRDEIGEKFLYPPLLDLSKIYEESDEKTPLVLIQSPGTDPMKTLIPFVKNKNKLIGFVSTSLGENQNTNFEKLIEVAQIQGDWICLQNCHLSMMNLSKLETIVETFDTENFSSEFRLWLTTDSADNFPASILKSGVKVTIETPTSLKDNLYQRFTSEPVSDLKFYESCPGKEQVFTTLLFSISFFHAIINERRKFGALGWNKPYHFDESDFLISILQLQMFITNHEQTTLPALQYLISECNYGGKLTDMWDKRVLNTILNDFVNEDIIYHKKYLLIENNESYRLPVRNDYKDFIECIKNLPLFTVPEVHGLNVNAGIEHDLKRTSCLINCLQSVFKCSLKEEISLHDTVLQESAETILSKIPEQFYMDAAQRYPYCYTDCMSAVMVQEIEKLNRIISTINVSLTNLVNAMKGLTELSPELETISYSLLKGKVPNDWLKVSYPSLKTLGGYITDLIRRVCFSKEWYDNKILKDYWISGISFTQAFITSIVLNYSRKHTIPYDNLTFDFEVLYKDRAEEYPENGILVYGLFLTGARWDRNEFCLKEERLMEFSNLFPLLCIKACLKEELQINGRYVCPLYTTLERQGNISTSGHSTNFIFPLLLPIKETSAHWVKRGVAVICQTSD